MSLLCDRKEIKPFYFFAFGEDNTSNDRDISSYMDV